MKDLKEKTVRGGLARVIAQMTNFGLRIGSLMILARLLDPQDFGLVGMVLAFTGFLSLFRDFGLSTATVQRSSVTHEQISTLFWMNILFGTSLTVLTAALAPVIESVYHEPRLFTLTLVLSLSFFFNGLGVQHGAILQREMRFTALSVINVVGTGASVAIAILMAKAGFGYWSLAALAVTAPVFTSAGTLIAGPWWPGLPRRGIGLRSMMHFGGTITLNGIVVYAAYNLEKVLLGRYWGVDAIGIYGRAYQLVNIPTDNLNSAAGEVAFSALSRLQSEPDRLARYFLKGYSLVLALTVPITLCGTIFAQDAIHLLLGPKWQEAVPIFRLLAPTILIFAMINPFAWLLFAIGKVQRSLKIAFVIAPLVMSGYLLGLRYGPKGVALGYSSAMALWLFPHIAWCVKGTAISMSDVMRTLVRPLSAGILASLPAVLVFHIPGFDRSSFLRLIAGGGVFLTAYVVILAFVMDQRKLFMEVIQGMRHRVHSEQSAATTEHRPDAVAEVFEGQ